jgi:hypothetical protein
MLSDGTRQKEAEVYGLCETLVGKEPCLVYGWMFSWDHTDTGIRHVNKQYKYRGIDTLSMHRWETYRGTKNKKT